MSARCVDCRRLVQDRYSIDRDEILLCDACAGYSRPTLVEILDRIARPTDVVFAFRESENP